MDATTPIVTPTIVPVHEEELELDPAPDRCVASKNEVVVFGVLDVVGFTAVEVVDATVDTG